MASENTVAIIGGGPSGLMAAETARAAGLQVDLYEGKGSVGRKFLIAGKGGLNLTHSEPAGLFAQRYGERSAEVGRWLSQWDADTLRQWARDLGIETFVGSSGRVFPSDMKAAPLLRAWVRRLRESGVRFLVNHRCRGWDAEGRLLFHAPQGETRALPDACVLAMGGGSWPQLGSDGAWTHWLGEAGADIAPLVPSNCGFDHAWSDVFKARFAGHPVKPAVLTVTAASGEVRKLQGEFVITDTGIEGSLVYALSPLLRETIATTGSARVWLDLAPGRDEVRLRRDLSRPRNGRSTTEFLRRAANITGVQAGLINECVPRADIADIDKLVGWIKAMPIEVTAARPLAEAISSAGGVRFSALDERLMLRRRPGVFCAGEMVDWEAPTGGYLLAASLASGRVAGLGVAAWLDGRTRGLQSPA